MHPFLLENKSVSRLPYMPHDPGKGATYIGGGFMTFTLTGDEDLEEHSYLKNLEAEKLMMTPTFLGQHGTETAHDR